MAKILKSKPHPKFGATKAQGKRNQELRDLHNKIFQLEEHIADVDKRLKALSDGLATFLREFHPIRDRSDRDADREFAQGLEARISERKFAVLDGVIEAIREIRCATGKAAP